MLVICADSWAEIYVVNLWTYRAGIIFYQNTNVEKSHHLLIKNCCDFYDIVSKFICKNLKGEK